LERFAAEMKKVKFHPKSFSRIKQQLSFSLCGLTTILQVSGQKKARAFL